MAEVITDGSIESLEQYLDIDELPDPEAEPAVGAQDLYMKAQDL